MIFQLTRYTACFVIIIFEDPEGNGFKFYVDKDEAQWTRQNDLVKLILDH